MVTTIIKDWPDGLTWGLSERSTEFLVFAEKGRGNYWGTPEYSWFSWQGDLAESPIEGHRPKQFVLPLEYLT